MINVSLKHIDTTKFALIINRAYSADIVFLNQQEGIDLFHQLVEFVDSVFDDPQNTPNKIDIEVDGGRIITLSVNQASAVADILQEIQIAAFVANIDAVLNSNEEEEAVDDGEGFEQLMSDLGLSDDQPHNPEHFHAVDYDKDIYE